MTKLEVRDTDGQLILILHHIQGPPENMALSYCHHAYQQRVYNIIDHGISYPPASVMSQFNSVPTDRRAFMENIGKLFEHLYKFAYNIIGG